MSDTEYVEDAIHAHLQAATSITDLVSDRVFPNLVPPENSGPAIMFRKISGSRAKPHNLGTGPLVRGRFEFNCYGDSFSDAARVCSAVLNLLDGFRGDLGEGVKTTAVDIVDFTEPRDSYDPELQRHKRQLDAMILYRA
jgi:hypothetical protein